MVNEKISDNPVESFLHSRENKESAEFDNHSDLNFDIYGLSIINDDEEIASLNFEIFFL